MCWLEETKPNLDYRRSHLKLPTRAIALPSPHTPHPTPCSLLPAP
ncbi:hypothetical protein [Moorena producens]|nr:hypothetical protein [Moorena producens]